MIDCWIFLIHFSYLATKNNDVPNPPFLHYFWFSVIKVKEYNFKMIVDPYIFPFKSILKFQCHVIHVHTIYNFAYGMEDTFLTVLFVVARENCSY